MLGAAAGVLVTAMAGVVAMNVIGDAPDRGVQVAAAQPGTSCSSSTGGGRGVSAESAAASA
ncbi:MAG: hypothetical protein HY830_14970, partial [Actinobacteria bacterium]|nr:hypothetical protein [Actinomycetota bacterium]